jgi:CHAT domain-containing protein/tetratricopeptide (TPR) repeat protein
MALSGSCRIPSNARIWALAIVVLAGASRSFAQGAAAQVVSGQEETVDRAIQLVEDGQSLVDAGRLDESEKKLRDALALYDSIRGDHADAVFGRANCYAVLGRIVESRGNRDQALQLWGAAVEQYGRLNGTEVLNNLAAVYKRMTNAFLAQGKTEAALDVLKKADDIETKIGAGVATQAQEKTNIGVLLHRLGRNSEAEPVLQKAVSLSEEGNLPPDRQAVYLSNLALAERGLHKTELALKYLQRSLSLLAALEHMEEPRITALLEMAEVLSDEKRMDEARDRLGAALEIAVKMPESRALHAQVLIELGTAERNGPSELQADALIRFREALSLVEGIGGSEAAQIDCIENIADLLHKSGKTDEAIELYREWLSRVEVSALHPGNARISEVHNNLGLYLLEAGRGPAALDELVLSLRNAWADLVGRMASLTLNQTQQQTELLAHRTNLIFSLALTSPKTAAPRAYEALLLTKALFSETARARQHMLLDSRVSGLAPSRERYLELRRQMSRRTLDTGHAEVPMSSEAMVQLAAEMETLERDLLVKSLAFRGGTLLTPVRVDEVRSRLRPGEVLLEYFTWTNVDLGSQKAGKRHYGAFVMRGTGGTIEMVDLGESAVAVAAVQAFRDCEARQADPLRPSLDENELAGLGERLRRLVLDPVLAPGALPKRIYVAAAGMLGAVPFDALPIARTAAGWRYLAEDAEIVNLLTGRELAGTAAGRSSSGEAWLVGDPDFDATPAQRITAFNGSAEPLGEPAAVAGGPQKPDAGSRNIPADWQSMKDTQKLVESAARQASRAGLKPRTLLGAAASEESLDLVRAPRLLLFATHGYFLTKMPPIHVTGSLHFSSASTAPLDLVPRSESTPNGAPENTMVIDNQDSWETFSSLHRSMMILAGANDRVHHVVRYVDDNRLLPEAEAEKQGLTGKEREREIGDGLLTAYKVLGMNLDGTELVLLAGCESGLGVTPEDPSPGFRFDSESVIGLRQAFTIAGARSVVTSVWEVPLDQTVAQMTSFLDGWLQGQQPRYESFRESQLEALRSARSSNLGGHPLWWAGFIYFGDPGDR